jgi:Sigma-54 interaction domain
MASLPETKEFLGTTAVLSSDAMRQLLFIVEKVAVTDATVLITGESGTGKEVSAGDPSLFRAQLKSLGGHKLRRAAGEPLGKRAVWT